MTASRAPGAEPLAFTRTGAGEQLVLLHGLGSRRQIWDPLIGRLSERCEVFAVDLRGFGASAYDGPAGVCDQVEAVAEFCRSHGLDRPHLAGNSMGGGIALELGRRGLARSVTVFSPIGFWHRPGLWWCQGSLSALRLIGRVAGRWLPRLLKVRLIRAAFVGLVFGRPLSVDLPSLLSDVSGLVTAEGFAEARASFREFGYRTGQPSVTVPTTIAWGRRDLVLTFGPQHRRAARQAPAARHVTLPGCGHTPFYDDPKACAQVILATVARASTLIDNVPTEWE